VVHVAVVYLHHYTLCLGIFFMRCESYPTKKRKFFKQYKTRLFYKTSFRYGKCSENLRPPSPFMERERMITSWQLINILAWFVTKRITIILVKGLYQKQFIGGNASVDSEQVKLPLPSTRWTQVYWHRRIRLTTDRFWLSVVPSTFLNDFAPLQEDQIHNPPLHIFLTRRYRIIFHNISRFA
jgi:hypothetical protein